MAIKLLVTDDEDGIRRGVAKYIELHTSRFERIYEAENGQEAIELMLKYHPEVLLLDVQMPLKNGIDVMKEAERVGLHPIVVILSGYDEFAYAQQALRLGAREYLLKPVRASDILSCLNRLVDETFGREESTLPEEEFQSNQIVKRAVEYITEHYMENITSSEVSEAVGSSAGYLSTLFTQNLECGFVDYLNRVRVERACGYLEQSFLKTYEIAYKVGFRDEKYFSKVFKKIQGVTPKEYRNAPKQEKRGKGNE